jgi:hypothetical protein
MPSQPFVSSIAFSCPGAVMFLFTVPSNSAQPKRYLHCKIDRPCTVARYSNYATGGDFRANSRMKELYPSIFNTFLDIVYLDTTYLRPDYTFPDQEKVINELVGCVDHELKTKRKKFKTLHNYFKPKDGGSSLENPSKRKKLKTLDNYFKPENAVNSEDNTNDKPTSDIGTTLVVVGSYTIGKEKIFQGSL